MRFVWDHRPGKRHKRQQRYFVDPVGNNCNCIVPLLENPGFCPVVAAAETSIRSAVLSSPDLDNIFRYVQCTMVTSLLHISRECHNKPIRSSNYVSTLAELSLA